MVSIFEKGNTVQFTWVSSVAPDSAPILKITDGLTDAIIASVTALQSAATAYYALYTMPNSDGEFSGEWIAQKTVNGSAYDFIRRFGFRVATTQPTP